MRRDRPVLVTSRLVLQCAAGLKTQSYHMITLSLDLALNDLPVQVTISDQRDCSL